MKYTLDSNACIVHFRTKGISAVSRRLILTPPTDVCITSIVRAELLYGAQRSNDVARNMTQVRNFVDKFATLVFDDDAAEIYGVIRAGLMASGKPIGPNDLFIAAIAVAANVTLITNNTREFSRVPGLKLEDWQLVP